MEAPGEVRPILHMPVRLWQRMRAFINACPEEINGFGYVEQVATNEFVLSDLFILEQHVTAGSVDCLALAVGNHMNEMARNGQNTALMRFQWHSHVDFNAYYSGVDVNTIETAYPGAPWMISLVMNKSGEFKCRLDIYKGIRLTLDMEIKHYVPEDPDVEAFVAAEIANKVKQRRAVWFPGRNASKSVKPEPIDSTVKLDGEVTYG